MDINEYIMPELLVLIPVLYCIGMALKSTSKIKDTMIPISLGIIGIVLALIWTIGAQGVSLESVYTGIVQGILVAGASVYTNQVYKQTLVKEE